LRRGLFAAWCGSFLARLPSFVAWLRTLVTRFGALFGGRGGRRGLAFLARLGALTSRRPLSPLRLFYSIKLFITRRRTVHRFRPTLTSRRLRFDGRRTRTILIRLRLDGTCWLSNRPRCRHIRITVVRILVAAPAFARSGAAFPRLATWLISGLDAVGLSAKHG